MISLSWGFSPKKSKFQRTDWCLPWVGEVGEGGQRVKKGKNAEKNHIQNADYMLMNMT